MSNKEFTDFNLITPIHRALCDMDYTVPTPVQLQAIPPLLAGRDLLGCAQTGTGKTAAFALPIIQHLAKNQRRRERGFVRALIVTPTRELAAQIYENLNMYCKYLDVNSIVVFGGVKQNAQVKSLNKGVDILVATPGRLLDLINQGYIKLEKVEFFVLDEADRMLDMGFIPDVRRILKYLPN
ncbi:MAG: DEAD/DEAH box helicase, partial [Thermoplasmata archaeon]|nr:DEAD/DEAH box helicase [Thermoplasmata archaeon]